MSAVTNIRTNSWPRDALRIDTVLHGYRIVDFIGRGGFGITYRAIDAIDQNFAIKEFYPKQFVVRDGNEVHLSDDSAADIVANCLDRFTREARALTLFSNSGTLVEGVVKVNTFFEMNNTAYIVMEFVEGISMERLIADHPDGLPEPMLWQIMHKLLLALENVHKSGLLHRDIKPANIMIRRKNNSPVLLDFGAVRALRSSSAASTMAIYTEAYAPIEQIGGQDQGPYSDLYSLGVTCYQALAGARFGAAPASTERAVGAAREADPLVPAVTIGAGRYSEGLLRAIDLLLPVKPEDRPSSVAEFLPHFTGVLSVAQETFEGATRIVDANATRVASGPKVQTKDEASSAATIVGFNQAPSKGADPSRMSMTADTVVAVAERRHVTPPRAGSNVVLIIVVALVLAGAASAGVYYFINHNSPTKVQAGNRTAAAVEADTSSVQPHEGGAPNADLPTSPELSQANAAYERKDYAEAARLYLAAAAANNAQAQYQLGYMYQLGQGVAQDYNAAAHWYALAAGQGSKGAQLQLGYLAQNGLGTPKNYATALHWYQLAASQGSAPAQNQLGYLYQMGYGVPVNYAEALRWYQSAAQQGSAAAQFRIGHFYAEGLGVFRDLATARDWMSRAAAGGNADARMWLMTH